MDLEIHLAPHEVWAYVQVDVGQSGHKNQHLSRNPPCAKKICFSFGLAPDLVQFGVRGVGKEGGSGDPKGVYTNLLKLELLFDVPT